MKKLALITAAALASALVAAPAFAFDELVTNDTSAITPVGGLQVSAGLAYFTASDVFDKDSEAQELGEDATTISIPLKASYGVMDKLSVFAVLPFVSFDNGNDSETGLGDVWLGAKYNVLENNLFTVRGALDIPLGDDEKGLGNEGGFGIDVAAMTAYQMDQIGLNGQVGIRWNAEDSDTKMTPGLGIYLDAEGSYNLTEAFAAIVGFEFFTQGDGQYDGNDVNDSAANMFQLDLGAKYMMAEKMCLRGDIMYTLAGMNVYKDMGIYLTFGYVVK